MLSCIFQRGSENKDFEGDGAAYKELVSIFWLGKPHVLV
jgi:hypothetical protein